MNETAVHLIGQADLYAALRRLSAALQPADATGFLARCLTDLDAGDTPARQTAARLRAVDQGLLQAVIRRGAGSEAVMGATDLRAHLVGVTAATLFQPDIAGSTSLALLTGGQHPTMPAFSDPAFDTWFAAQGVRYGLGAYGENRTVYKAAQFADAASAERRTVHLGIDIFAPAGTPVFAPISGRVAFVAYNADPLDYGHTLILEHSFGEQRYWTLYGHLGSSLPDLCHVGYAVDAGQMIAHLGDWPENGGWAAHVHFQIMSTLLDQTTGNFFGVGHTSLWDIWSDICPDPNLILRLPADRFRLI